MCSWGWRIRHGLCDENVMIQLDGYTMLKFDKELILLGFLGRINELLISAICVLNTLIVHAEIVNLYAIFELSKYLYKKLVSSFTNFVF